MKTDSEKRTLQFFMGGLAIVALFINACFMRQEPERINFRQEQQSQIERPATTASIADDAKARKQRDADEARARQEQAEWDAAAQYEKFLRQYVNPGFSRKVGRKTIALAAISDRGNFNQSVSREIIRRCSSERAEIYSSFFTPKFYTDGLFSTVFNGSSQAASDLRLADLLDGLLLALQQVTYSTNASLENLITANVRLDILAAPVSGNGQSQSWGFTANGAGFHATDALLMAEERLIKQISTDTNISLNEISQLQTQ